MNLLNKNSGEIARLENLVTSARSVLEVSETEKVIRDSTAISWKEDDPRLLEERRALKAEQNRTAFAEKNAEVFREQYLRASSFVDDLRAQNMELQERAEVAESQASTGIANVRTMYEARVQQLEEETEYHKRVTTFLIEQSQRTQDDEIRRRAAEHLELEGRCTELETKNSHLEDMFERARSMIDVLEKLVSERDKENEVLIAEKRTKQEELERLRRVLEESQREMETDLEPSVVPMLNDEPATAETEQETVSGEIGVYMCLWRKDGREKCDAFFLSVEVCGCSFISVHPVRLQPYRPLNNILN